MKWETSSGLTDEKVECHCRESGRKGLLDGLARHWLCVCRGAAAALGLDSPRTPRDALKVVDIDSWASVADKQGRLRGGGELQLNGATFPSENPQGLNRDPLSAGRRILEKPTYLIGDASRTIDGAEYSVLGILQCGQ